MLWGVLDYGNASGAGRVSGDATLAGQPPSTDHPPRRSPSAADSSLSAIGLPSIVVGLSSTATGAPSVANSPFAAAGSPSAPTIYPPSVMQVQTQ